LYDFFEYFFPGPTTPSINSTNGTLPATLSVYGTGQFTQTSTFLANVSSSALCLGGTCNSTWPSAGGITSLNGLTTSTQSFATTTNSGSGLNIVSSGNTHTFSLSSNLTTIGGLGLTKGNLIVGNGSNWAALAVGANGQVLMASSTAANGVSWGTVSSGGGSVSTSSAITANYFPYWANTSGALSGTSTIFFSGGNVGIGTTNPGQKLEVVGNVSSSAVCLGGTCNTTWPPAGTNYWTLSGSNLYPNSTSYNVGIGTTGPGFPLEVNGSAAVTTLLGRTTSQNANDTLYLGTSGQNFFLDRPGAASVSNQIVIGYNTAKPTAQDAPFSVYNNSTDRQFLLIAQSKGSSSGSDAVIMVPSSGNVGIGTTGPNGHLTIGNNVYTPPLGSSYSQYQILLYDGSAANSSYGVGVEASNFGFNSNGGYKFYQSGGATPLMVIGGVASTNVGIGTASPGAKLDVAGGINLEANGTNDAPLEVGYTATSPAGYYATYAP
jgi:hypothetical protein